MGKKKKKGCIWYAHRICFERVSFTMQINPGCLVAPSWKSSQCEPLAFLTEDGQETRISFSSSCFILTYFLAFSLAQFGPLWLLCSKNSLQDTLTKGCTKSTVSDLAPPDFWHQLQQALYPQSHPHNTHPYAHHIQSISQYEKPSTGEAATYTDWELFQKISTSGEAKNNYFLGLTSVTARSQTKPR